MDKAGNSTVVASDTPRYGVLVACAAFASITLCVGLVICAKSSFQRLMGPAPPDEEGYNAL